MIKTGRSGVGAVMGSKNLKAIVINASKTSVQVHDPDSLKKINSECIKKLREHPHTGKNLKLYGTPVLVHNLNNAGSFPVKNFQGNYYDKAEEICRANHMCNEYGVDSISAPATIASAMELYQRGYITDEDCDGVPLKWGNAEAITVWTKRMCLAETPLGALMAQGSYRLCEHYGRPDLSMSVKKQEMAAYDPRGFQGMGLNYATSNRGACHVRGNTFSTEILGDRTATEGKATLVKVAQDNSALFDSIGLCLFTAKAISPDDLAQMLNSATGSNHTGESLLEIAERIYNLERMFNKEAGMKSEDDTLPKRITHETTDYGPSKGLVNKLDVMLPEYYELRGWKDGFPTEETIKHYKLDE